MFRKRYKSASLLHRTPQRLFSQPLFVNWWYEDNGTDEPEDFLWTRLQFKINRLGTALARSLEPLRDKCVTFAHVMYRQAPSGLSFVMVSNTWTRLSLEKMVVGSTALVLAFSVNVTFVSVVLFTREYYGLVHLHALRYYDFCAEVGVRSSGGHLLDDVRGLEHGLQCACGTCLQPILDGDPAAKVGKALLHVGSAVLNGAMTTLAASLFLLP